MEIERELDSGTKGELGVWLNWVAVTSEEPLYQVSSKLSLPEEIDPYV